ncbi:FliA/WhiG family RNA polymerase sigma factor [Desertibacillus haloalkaliphilus]|uniref:FliA/WhiG family RNA polymerase sigma factor n=1 Tax=Desertibacillus haloalkaliphilus TaxID=1328930 RepID=UPI001C256E4B|nr:FliA/WhiG family RNA polymerase sigma factor [Desertibacillus haloalkaliphilus]MBU8906988.1 FliA/WhiG family RNA polymerase sigma factor [Desertibacillus haloalkaliphilus]
MPSSSVIEDKQVWEKWVNDRDVDACDTLIRMYMPLVNYHVQRISVGLPRNVNKEDLQSHGMIGLYDALEKFDMSRDLKFDTYASFRIRGAIIDGLRREDWLPRSLREKAKKVEATMEKLEQTHGRYVTEEEVAKELGMTVEDVTQVLSESFMAHKLSIDEESNDSERDESFQTMIEDTAAQSPEESIMTEATKQELLHVIKQLNEKEQLVVSLFYYEELTLTEIGQVLGLSTSRISQIHSKALFRMQQVLMKNRS